MANKQIRNLFKGWEINVLKRGESFRLEKQIMFQAKLGRRRTRIS